MQPQLCKLCGERHHRYEPHRFALKPEVLQDAHRRMAEVQGHLADVFQAAPAGPRSNAQSPSHRTQGTGDQKTRSDPPDYPEPEPALEPYRDRSRNTPDTAPTQPPLSIAALDDTALRGLRNLVMAEVMRRRRKSQE